MKYTKITPDKMTPTFLEVMNVVKQSAEIGADDAAEIADSATLELIDILNKQLKNA